MPTPFTHLEIAQRLLQDARLPAAIHAERGAFLLGNIAADARVHSGAARDSTHFYQYRVGIPEHPWRVMVQQYPALAHPQDPTHRVFVAGYVAHLAVDEIWSLELVGPHFARREWGGDLNHRFFMLQVLLIAMDERDFLRLDSWQGTCLESAAPRQWLPFITDSDLRHWQEFIAEQLQPGGSSKTLAILGERIGKTPAQLREMVDSAAYMQRALWQHIPKSLLDEVEAHLYTHALEQLIVYWNG